MKMFCFRKYATCAASILQISNFVAAACKAIRPLFGSLNPTEIKAVNFAALKKALSVKFSVNDIVFRCLVARRVLI